MANQTWLAVTSIFLVAGFIIASPWLQRASALGQLLASWDQKPVLGIGLANYGMSSNPFWSCRFLFDRMKLLPIYLAMSGLLRSSSQVFANSSRIYAEGLPILPPRRQPAQSTLRKVRKVRRRVRKANPSNAPETDKSAQQHKGHLQPALAWFWHSPFDFDFSLWILQNKFDLVLPWAFRHRMERLGFV